MSQTWLKCVVGGNPLVVGVFLAKTPKVLRTKLFKIIIGYDDYNNYKQLMYEFPSPERCAVPVFPGTETKKPRETLISNGEAMYLYLFYCI